MEVGMNTGNSCGKCEARGRRIADQNDREEGARRHSQSVACQAILFTFAVVFATYGLNRFGLLRGPGASCVVALIVFAACGVIWALVIRECDKERRVTEDGRRPTYQFLDGPPLQAGTVLHEHAEPPSLDLEKPWGNVVLERDAHARREERFRLLDAWSRSPLANPRLGSWNHQLTLFNLDGSYVTPMSVALVLACAVYAKRGLDELIARAGEAEQLRADLATLQADAERLRVDNEAYGRGQAKTLAELEISRREIEHLRGLLEIRRKSIEELEEENTKLRLQAASATSRAEAVEAEFKTKMGEMENCAAISREEVGQMPWVIERLIEAMTKAINVCRPKGEGGISDSPYGHPLTIFFMSTLSSLTTVTGWTAIKEACEKSGIDNKLENLIRRSARMKKESYRAWLAGANIEELVTYNKKGA